jgi:general secretion pathway protein F
MASFDYEALDGAGRVRRGVVTADSARLARRELRENRLTPIRVIADAAAPAKGREKPIFRTARVGSADLMLMTRQLATLTSAAAPLEESLHTIAIQSDNKVLRTALLSIRAAVSEGQRLSDAMAQHPRIFNAIYRALVAAGELSGALGPVLERLADGLEKSERMRAKVTAALVYPLVLATVAAGVVTLLIAFVVPKVAAQFDSLGQDLPLLTRALIAVSEGVQSYGLFVLAAAVVGIVAAARLLRDPRMRLAFDGALLRLPVIGKLLRSLTAARLTRTLGTLTACGVPVLDAMVAAKATIGNRVIGDAVAGAAAAVRTGSSLSNAFRAAKVLPPVVVYMAAVGESTGRLDTMLEKAADQLDREFEGTTAIAIGLLEPGIIVVMGALVGLIVLAILMPVFQLNSLALM